MSDKKLATMSKDEMIVVGLLTCIQFCHILDFVIMMPLGPQFMRNFSITPSEFSIVVSAYTFSAGIIGFIGALFGDSFDRKKLLLFCFLGFIGGTFLCGISPNFEILLSARIIAGAFGGFLNAIVFALISDLVGIEKRGRATGMVMSAFSLASVFGVPLGIFLATQFNWHIPFYFICLISLVCFALCLKFLPNVKATERGHTFKGKVQHINKIAFNNDNINAFLITSLLSFGVFGIVPFISPYMVKNIGVLESQLSYIYLMGGACTILSARFIGKKVDEKGSFYMFIRVALLSFIPMVLLTHLKPVPLILALSTTSLFMMLVSGRFIPAMTMISRVTTPEDRGSFMNLENAFRQVASGLAALIAGQIIQESNGHLIHYNFVGYIGVGATIISIFMAIRIRNKFKLS